MPSTGCASATGWRRRPDPGRSTPCSPGGSSRSSGRPACRGRTVTCPARAGSRSGSPTTHPSWALFACDSASPRRVRARRKRAMARQRLTGAGGVADLREALRSLVDPLGLVLLTRDRIEEALNDAVSRGRVTADDAQDLATALLERGRRQTNDVLGDLDKMLSAKASRAKRVAGVKGASSGPTPGVAGYDDLNAKQVQEKLAGLSPAKLRQVRDYERANANRKTVIA